MKGSSLNKRWNQNCGCNLLTSFLSTRHGSDDVRVSGVGDGESTNSEVLSTSCSKHIVVSSIVVDSSLGQHGVVLNLRLAERWGVVGDDHQLALAIPQGLEGLLVAKDVLASAFSGMITSPSLQTLEATPPTVHQGLTTVWPPVTRQPASRAVSWNPFISRGMTTSLSVSVKSLLVANNMSILWQETTPIAYRSDNTLAQAILPWR